MGFADAVIVIVVVVVVAALQVASSSPEAAGLRSVPYFCTDHAWCEDSALGREVSGAALDQC